jgi:hypothetical protein
MPLILCGQMVRSCAIAAVVSQNEIVSEIGGVARIILGHRPLQAMEIYSELNREQAIEVMGQVG